MTSPDSTPPEKPANNPGNILGAQPAGFSEPRKLDALSIKSRILAGEQIPLAELSAFILSAESDLTKARTTRNVKEKATDVDFF
jgi:hypothetical protein